MERITLYEELRLIERSENEVSNAWKGAHLLLFFLAFVFGSFCTFCFHMLMYLFDEKCVLFPKFLTLNSLHNVIYEFIPTEKKSDPLPLDFLNTHFVHKRVCYLPAYVPLVSGIFGLVWTTMFLMCSSGSRSLSGLHRPWRIIVPVLVFSTAMSLLCIYSSIVTHAGLLDLCLKLGEITGSTSCTYSVNVATLAYERQIRGVYQATRLTITSAWMHTACWVASAILAATRILLAVDFRLVKIRADLIGDMDRILELNEEHLHTVLPHDSMNSTESHLYSYFKSEHRDEVTEFGQLIDVGSDVLFVSEQPVLLSDHALLPEESHKSAKNAAYESVRRDHRFIVDLLYDFLDSLEHVIPITSSSSRLSGSSTETIARQYAQQNVSYKMKSSHHIIYPDDSSDSDEGERTFKEIQLRLLKKLQTRLIEFPLQGSDDSYPVPSTSRKMDRASFESLLNVSPELQANIRDRSKNNESSVKKSLKPSLKSDVKDASIQTETKDKKTHKVTIADTNAENLESLESSSDSNKDESIQTEPKQKQD